MTGYNGITIHDFCTLIQLLIFHIAVAVNAGIGRRSVFICGYKAVNYLTGEIVGKIKNIIRHIQRERDIARVLYILKGTAGMRFRNAHILVVIQFHGGTDAFISVFTHQRRRYRAVHTAAHRN